MKILVIIGTRPEAIKLAPIVLALKTAPSKFKVTICTTGQHKELLSPMLRQFSLRPQFRLEVMRHSQASGDIAARIYSRLAPVLRATKPDWVLVQGDTTTAAAAAVASVYSRCNVAHVEAGLRTHNRLSPFPEEINRRIIGTVANLHFAPTSRAKDNLLKEGISERDILITGNTVIDALRILTSSARYARSQAASLRGPSKIATILVTSHRRENFGEPIRNICLSIKEIIRREAGRVRFVWPIHPNPEVRRTVNTLLLGTPEIELIRPLTYLEFTRALSACTFVMTDSGGVQEEAPALGKPVLILRDSTERPEVIEAGAGILVGTDPNRIVRVARALLNNSKLYSQMSRAQNVFGDGFAAARIVQKLLDRPVADFRPPRPHPVRKWRGLT